MRHLPIIVARQGGRSWQTSSTSSQSKRDRSRFSKMMATPQGLARWWTKNSAGEPRQGAEYALRFGPEYGWKGRVMRCLPNSAFELEMPEALPDWMGTRVGCELRPEAEDSTLFAFITRAGQQRMSTGEFRAIAGRCISGLCVGIWNMARRFLTKIE